MRPATIYQLFHLTCRASIMFLAVTYSPFLQNIGLTMSEITVINWVFMLLVLLCQVPTGVFADRYGRGLSVKIGLAIMTLSHIAYYFAAGFWSALLVEAVCGVGMAFIAGADQAWITHELKRRNDKDSLEKVFGTTEIYSNMAALAAGLVGGFLGARNLRWPWLAATAFGFLSFLIASIYMRDPKQSKPSPADNVEANKKTENANKDLVKLSQDLLKRSYALKWGIMIICALSLCITFFHYFPLVYREYVSANSLAVLWIVIYSPKILGALLMRFMSKKLANGWGIRLLASSGVLAGIGLILAGYYSGLYWLIAGTVMVELAHGYFYPLISAFVQKRVGERYRATYGSLQSLITGVWTSIVMVAVASIMYYLPSDTTSVLALWWQIGVLLFVASLVLFVISPKARKN